MRIHLLLATCLGLSLEVAGAAAPPTPIRQAFQQEIARRHGAEAGLASSSISLIDASTAPQPRVFASGGWFQWKEGRWTPMDDLKPSGPEQFVFLNPAGGKQSVALRWADVRHLLHAGNLSFVATEVDVFSVQGGQLTSLRWPSRHRVHQIAADAAGKVWVASSAGLVRQTADGWAPVGITDGLGRAWGISDVLGIAFDNRGKAWVATKAGVATQTESGWRFFEGKDGLPWNDFTGVAAGPGGDVWFGTHLGAVMFDGKEWHYRQGPRWLPGDDIKTLAVGGDGRAWFSTDGGLGTIERTPMTLAAKAAAYEQEIARHIKRTPYGYIAQAHLRVAADRSTAQLHDDDNDGLWTAMYGAGECFAYAATRDPQARERARKAFEALRFLQKVTEGGKPAPPKGYIARSIRSIELPDPNAGRLEADIRDKAHDALWKAYAPRWPVSADGKWYWKSDTSSDELDGHYFFYPIYFDLVAETEAERESVRDVVRGITDHLMNHDFQLIEHDGKVTRWGVYSPKSLNTDPFWWPERGLNSLSMLSYLAVASHVTGDPKYAAASRELIDKHGYAHNAMYPKVQHGPGSGNQSDDEMAVMCFYNLLRYSKDEPLKALMRYSFHRYWVNEFPEMNPFFNFAYAVHGIGATTTNPFGTFPIDPWNGWLEDSASTLRGFSLDRLDWPHKNSHRLDILPMPLVRSQDIYAPAVKGRGYRQNGKVIPVENRHFNHWNTDPWDLDYGGSANVLASGTVFLLPYYMGMYHGYIEKP